VSVAGIPETGLELTLDLGADWFEDWQREDPHLEFVSPGSLTAALRLDRHGRDFLLRGRLEGEIHLSCSRCLEPLACPVAADFDILLVPGPEPVSSEDKDLTAEELDLDHFSGEVIDLEGILREQIILQIPIKALCAETCLGLCPHCGANRNREPCACQEKKSSSPLAALVKLKV